MGRACEMAKMALRWIEHTNVCMALLIEGINICTAMACTHCAHLCTNPFRGTVDSVENAMIGVKR